MGSPMKDERIGQAVVPAIAIIFAISYFIQTAEAPEGTLIWPAAMAVLAGVLLLIILVQLFFQKKEPQKTSLSSLKWDTVLKPLMILMGPILYVALLPVLGFTPANLIFLSLMFRALGGTRWLQNFVVAFIIALFLHLTLIVFMKLSLPRLVLSGTTIL
jgi:cobalamin synthase